jgi:hypothetical protein
VGRMWVEQVLFLALVPDWNAVEKVVDGVKKSSHRERGVREVNKEQIEILNKVGIYAK